MTPALRDQVPNGLNIVHLLSLTLVAGQTGGTTRGRRNLTAQQTVVVTHKTRHLPRDQHRRGRLQLAARSNERG